MSHDDAVRIAGQRYDMFDEQRRLAAAATADAEDLRQIEELEKELKGKQDDDAQ